MGALDHEQPLRSGRPYASLLDFGTESYLATEEPDLWTPSQARDFLDTLTETDIKRQEVIYELIHTEKNHYVVLLIMQQVYVRGLRKELRWSKKKIQKIFTALPELGKLHQQFLRQLRNRQQEASLVPAIGDILSKQFGPDNRSQVERSYGRFCGQHKQALAMYRRKLETNPAFAAFDKACVDKLRCHASHYDIPSCLLLVSQRLSKYLMLVGSLEKYAQRNSDEARHLGLAVDGIRHILDTVNSHVRTEENRARLEQIRDTMDPNRGVSVDGTEWKPYHLASRTLLQETNAQLRKSAGNLKDVTVLLLDNSVILLRQHGEHFGFYEADHKSAVIPLGNLIVKTKAELHGTLSTSVYLVSFRSPEHGTSDSKAQVSAEMYELTFSDSKTCKEWITWAENTQTQFIERQKSHQKSGISEHDSPLQRIRKVIDSYQSKTNETFESLRERMESFGIAQWIPQLSGAPSAARDVWSAEQVQSAPLNSMSQSKVVSETTNGVQKAETATSQAQSNLPDLENHFAEPAQVDGIPSVVITPAQAQPSKDDEAPDPPTKPFFPYRFAKLASLGKERRWTTTAVFAKDNQSTPPATNSTSVALTSEKRTKVELSPSDKSWSYTHSIHSLRQKSSAARAKLEDIYADPVASVRRAASSVTDLKSSIQSFVNKEKP